MTSVSFRVLGDPAPQGSKRHVGGGRMVESSKKVAPWRQAVAAAADQAADGVHGGERIYFFRDAPLTVDVTFVLTRPKTAPKRVIWPAKRPDLDKLARAVLDGIGMSGLWADDCQVVELRARKVFAEPGEPLGAIVTVTAT